MSIEVVAKTLDAGDIININGHPYTVSGNHGDNIVASKCVLVTNANEWTRDNEPIKSISNLSIGDQIKHGLGTVHHTITATNSSSNTAVGVSTEYIKASQMCILISKARFDYKH